MITTYLIFHHSYDQMMDAFCKNLYVQDEFVAS